MGCLSEVQEELTAGKLAGRIFCAKNGFEKTSIKKDVPPQLVDRVKEIITSLEASLIEKKVKEIAALPSKVLRVKTLYELDSHLIPEVKERVEKIFKRKQRREKANATNRLG